MNTLDLMEHRVHHRGMSPEIYLSVKEAAERLGVGEQRVRELLLEKRLEGFKRGREWRIPEDALGNIKAVPQGRPRKKKRGRPVNRVQK